MQYLDWVVANADAVAGVALAAVAIAVAVAGMTKTTKDDEVVRRVSVWVGKGVALLRSLASKRKGE